MNRYYFEADITGKCSVFVEAKDKDEAVAALENGEWSLSEGSEEWECNVDGNAQGGYLANLLETEKID